MVRQRKQSMIMNYVENIQFIKLYKSDMNRQLKTAKINLGYEPL